VTRHLLGDCSPTDLLHLASVGRERAGAHRRDAAMLAGDCATLTAQAEHRAAQLDRAIAAVGRISEAARALARAERDAAQASPQGEAARRYLAFVEARRAMLDAAAAWREHAGEAEVAAERMMTEVAMAVPGWAA
jgi:hypothetical protein